MIEQNTLVAKPTAIILTDSTPDHKRALRKAQEGLERGAADRTARPAQANEQLRHEVEERRHAEERLLKERRYLRYLLEVQDRDRQMVSYEIHDGLVQQLAAAIMQLEMFGQLVDGRTTRSGRLSRLGCKGSTSVCGKHAS